MTSNHAIVRDDLLYQSYGFVPEERRKVLGIDFQRMVYTVK